MGWLLAYYYNKENDTFYVDELCSYNKKDKNIIKIGLCFEIDFLELIRRAKKRYPKLVKDKVYIHVEFDVPDLPF